MLYCGIGIIFVMIPENLQDNMNYMGFSDSSVYSGFETSTMYVMIFVSIYKMYSTYLLAQHLPTYIVIVLHS